MKRKQSGFTLVEIAIVLVIIGLLLGGILKGQEMITQAKIKNVISDFSGIAAAQYGYQDRYRAIPGNDPGAKERWTASDAFDGSGSGVLTGKYNDPAPPTPSATTETTSYWQHLRLAGFVGGPTTAQQSRAQPQNAAAGMVGVQSGDGGVPPKAAMAGVAAGSGGFIGIIMCSANLPDKIAIAVDTQLDDGNAQTGSVRAQLQAGPNPPVSAPLVATDVYVENGSNQYLLCKSF